MENDISGPLLELQKPPEKWSTVISNNFASYDFPEGLCKAGTFKIIPFKVTYIVAAQAWSSSSALLQLSSILKTQVTPLLLFTLTALCALICHCNQITAALRGTTQ